MSAATSAIRRHISASWKQRTGSRAAPMRSFKTTSAPRDAYPAELVNRRFVARGLNELWVADIPYVRAQAGWACASFITNAHSRRPHAPPGGQVPGPRGYRQRLWPCRANIQHDDRRAGREEEGTRLKPLPSARGPAPPSARASLTFHRTKHDPSPHTHTHR